MKHKTDITIFDYLEDKEKVAIKPSNCCESLKDKDLIKSIRKMSIGILCDLFTHRKEKEIIRLIGMKMATIREKELETAISHSSSTDVETLLDDMSRAIVNKITADLYVNLRRASREGDISSCNTLAELFGVR